MRVLFLFLATFLALYTQLFKLTAVPGLHFDEGWQGVFAHRILTEPGFYPVEAMNPYTTPIVHYILALFFKIFSPSLVVMRGVYAGMNLTSLALLSAFLWRHDKKNAAAWLVLIWALLPLAVHDHRFYVEVTGFYGLCLALTIWGLDLWNRRPQLSSSLVAGSILAAAYSHILFVSVLVAAIFVLACHFPEETKSWRAKMLFAMIALLLFPLPVRMGLGLGKISPFLLAFGLTGLSGVALFSNTHWSRWIDYSYKNTDKIFRWLLVLALPFLFAFVGLIWNGFWPYAQATGHLQLRWLPINAIIFIALAAIQLKTKEQSGIQNILWHSFVAVFLMTSILILKQSPRYYMVPGILAMMWCATVLGDLGLKWIQGLLGLGFVTWNLWAFQTYYIAQFEREGSTTQEFKFLFFHDNGRDFRPFQKIFQWGIETNCLAPKPWVEDDRFARPFDFMQYTQPKALQSSQPCPWNTEDLFFSHITNYDPTFAGQRNDANTPPPKGAENVKFLAHFPEWGDLAVWIRR